VARIGRSTVNIKVFRSPGPSFTWAGAVPGTKDLCFATEDGTLWMTKWGGTSGPPLISVVDCGEAINGVAFAGDWVAVSTASEIVVTKFAQLKAPGPETFTYDGGAHGIIPDGRGGFLAPLGPNGLLSIEMSHEGPCLMREIRPTGRDLYFYKLARLGLTDEAGELFLAAGRTDGLLAIQMGPGAGQIVDYRGKSLRNGLDLDIVDACGLGDVKYPFAASCLGIDNSIHIGRDFRRPDMTSLLCPEMRGTAYSILSVRGHLFILTSAGLYTFPNLSDQFLRGETIGGRIKVHFLPFDAVDCSAILGEYVLVVEAREVNVILVDEYLADLEINPVLRANGGGLPCSQDSQLYLSTTGNSTWEMVESGLVSFAPV